jgi:D-alanyl-D-alanine endopeptidase (penicillin-binding protein 7)
VRPDQLFRTSVRIALTAAFAVLLGWSAPAIAGSPQSAAKKPAVPAKKTATRSSSSRAVREAMKPRYTRDASGDLVPDVRAEAAIIFSPETGRVLWEAHAHELRSIASITKVMTVLVFLESGADLDSTVTVTRADLRRASTTYLRAGEKLLMRDVLNLTLVASDNAAARVLARSAGYASMDAFLSRMNEKAIELGLEDTSFTDPSGLDADNLSSAYDVSRLITFAARDERIAGIMQQPEYTFRTSRRKSVRVRNTNKLIGQLDVVGGKTGFISRAGYCLATLLKLPEGQDVAVVVLGARSNLGRFWETRHLFNWLKDRSAILLGDSSQ